MVHLPQSILDVSVPMGRSDLTEVVDGVRIKLAFFLDVIFVVIKQIVDSGDVTNELGHDAVELDRFGDVLQHRGHQPVHLDVYGVGQLGYLIGKSV